MHIESGQFLKVVEVKPYLRQMQTRMPFRFGKTIMTGMPVLHLRVQMQTPDGKSFEGWSACGLVSMWFDKDYSKSEALREADLLFTVGMAANGYLSAGSGSAWELHRVVEPFVRQKLIGDGLNGLTAGYGIALMDAAIVDGVCRFRRESFYDALRGNSLGFDPGRMQSIPCQPTMNMALRHTIGLGDPLTNDDVEVPINDGLPETLEQVIDGYGIKYFKIKVNNNRDESLERLERIAKLLDAKLADYQVTLDGNEAFPDMDSFYEFALVCSESTKLRSLWDRVLWVEQPVARQVALRADVAASLKQVSALKPVIIDESDDNDSVLEHALKLGYSGISAKNCKGVFRTLNSYQSIHAAAPNSRFVLSSEDLTNQPILPNHQDLCVAAALGIEHSERNGHHFFKGFQFLPEVEREQALSDYPSLYRKGKDGIPSLLIKNGQMSLKELNHSPGLGVVHAPDWSTMNVVDLPQRAPAVL